MKKRYYLLTTLLLQLAVTVGASDIARAAGNKSAAPWVGETLEGAPCKGRSQGYGPYDYTLRATYMENLKIVENFHFTPPVEKLVRGENGSIPGDIDYTLSAWPNHHRALNSISRYDLGYPSKRRQPVTPVECYFQRAIYFSPRDSAVHMLYAIYLHKSGHHEKAQAQYQKGLQISPNDIQIQYNLALLYVEMEQYEKAQVLAKRVYEQDFPLPGLKRKLTEAGFWDQAAAGATTGAESN